MFWLSTMSVKQSKDLAWSSWAFGDSFSAGGSVAGIHDIHMNQSNLGNGHLKDSGIWQDGALLVNLPAQDAWIAVFIAFAAQRELADRP
jgi:uncharacterized protein YukJ